MKKPYKQNNFSKIKNINKVRGNFHRRYSFFGINLSVKNKEKINFYKRSKEEIKNKKYLENKAILDELKKYRENKEYILTVFITTYNHKTNIRKAIESVLNQCTKYDYLIKILDDCSTDGTTEICLEYAKAYPEKIQLIIMKKNTNLKHLSAFYKTINTKYFAILDGDDYWCSDKKIETAVDFLEQNPQYVIWAHDTLFKNHITGKEYSYVHGHLGYGRKINPDISFNNYIYLHLSARVHRNVIDWNKEYIANRKRDIFIYYAIIDKGPVYYYDKIMSVYNFTGYGIFSKWSNIESYYSTKYSYYSINKYLNFRNDKYFTMYANSKKLVVLKRLFGKRIGWLIWIILLRYQYFFDLCIDKYNNLKKIERGHNQFDKKELEQINNIARLQV